MAQQKAFIAMPSHDGLPKMATLFSLVQFITEANANGLLWELKTWIGDSIVASARNVMAGAFLQSDCTDMVFIDSDVSWEIGALTRLLSHPVDMVAGVYRTKKDEQERYPVRFLDPSNIEQRDDGLIETETVPLGFSRITRSALHKMVRHYDYLNYDCEMAPGVPLWCLFDNELKDRKYWGEDFVFCKRWRAIGGQIYVDPELHLGHTGMKQFDGHLGEWLRKNTLNKPDKEVTEKLANLVASPEFAKLLAAAEGKAA